MQKLIYLLYNMLAVPVLRLGFLVFSRFNSKARMGYEGRARQRHALAYALARIPEDTQRVFVHCTSVGEYEQAVPVIAALKAQNPDLFVIVSFYSASGYNYVKNNPDIGLKIYLPLDVYARARRLLTQINPVLFMISKFDVWPNFMAAAGKLGIPVVMIAATLSENSRRDKGLAKALNQHAFKHFDFIFPISEDDRARFIALYPYPDRMLVAGDTRFDQVYKKGQKILKQAPAPLFENQEGLVFIAGSIWPADEKHLMPALGRALNRYPTLRAILVPHELHEAHLVAIEQALADVGVQSERYTTFETKGQTNARVAIVDTIGMLAKLYAHTDFAYIGGSFSTGVHNVMEPAVFGQPVIFGPKYTNSFEAMELEKIESGFSIQNEAELEKFINIFTTDHARRTRAGENAKALVEKNVGAADKILNILNQRYEHIRSGTTR